MDISAQGRCATASVKTKNTRWHPGPFNRARISTFVRCNTQATFFPLCRRSVHKKSQQNKNPKNTTNQSKGFKTASFQDRCCSFQEQSKSFIIKKQGKKKITKPNAKSNVQVWNSEDESRDRSRPRFRLKHRTQNALWKNSSHCKSHLQLRRVFVYLYKNTPAPPKTAWGRAARGFQSPGGPSPWEGQGHLHRLPRAPQVLQGLSQQWALLQQEVFSAWLLKGRRNVGSLSILQRC